VFQAAASLGLAGSLMGRGLGPSAARPARQEPKSGGTLGVGLPIEPDILDPHVGSSRYDTVVEQMLYDTLVFRTEAGEFQPFLATSWAVSDDGLSWTFHLRNDVTFHDGTPFNAEAMKFSFDRMIDPATKSQASAEQLGPYKSSEVVDPFTIKVDFKSPYAAFLSYLSEPSLAPVSPAGVKKAGADFGTQPVGTGPFKFVEWTPQSDIQLARNSDYKWGPPGFHQGPAYLDGVRFTFIPDESQRINALETGETDVILYAPAREVAGMKDKGFNSAAIEVPGIAQVCIVNAAMAPTAELAVRQAINWGVNQQAIIDVINDGVGKALHNVISPGVWGYDPAMEHMYTHDPQKAAALLDGAGWTKGSDGIMQKNGQPLDMLWLHFPNRTPGVPELMQAQLREIGVNVNIEAADNPGNMTRARAGQVNLEWMTWESFDPSILRILYHSENIGGGWNYAFYRDPHLDQVLEAIDSTIDQTKRKALVAEAQKIIMEQALVLPLQVDTNVVMWSPRTNGVKAIAFKLFPYDTFINES
jgi:peptide/nickel transport system substrate-binding protein